MTEDSKKLNKFERLVKEHPELFDYEDCRPLRTPEEIGMSMPPGLFEDTQGEDASDNGENS